MAQSQSDQETFIHEARGWIDKGELPGMQCVMIERGTEVLRQNLGFQDIAQQIPVTDQTLYRLASASKLLVSVGFLRLVQSGKVALKDAVSSVLPEYQTLDRFEKNGDITKATNPMLMEDLLRHTCGFGYGDKGPYRDALMTEGLLGVDDLGYDHWQTELSLREWVKALAAVPMEDEPGTRVKYGLGHDIAGAVMEAATGEPLDVYMKREVFEPLGMANSFFVVPENRCRDLSAFYSQGPTLIESSHQSGFVSRPLSFSGGGGWDMLGNGGIVSNARDMVSILQMIVNGGKHNDKNFLWPKLADRLCHSQSKAVARPMMLAGCEYSYGAAEVTNPSTYEKEGTGSLGPAGKMWWGGSTNTYFFYVPATQKIGVMMSNAFPFGHKGAVFKFGRLSV